MGYYPYLQKCVNGHVWSAAFCSVEPMSDTGRAECPECGGEVVSDKEKYDGLDPKDL